MAVELDGIAPGLYSTLPSLHEAPNTQTENEASDTNGGFLYVVGTKDD